MLKIIILILFYLFFPVVFIWMCRKYPLFKKAGCIVLAYGFGLLLGSSGILPRGSEAYRLALQGKTALPNAELETLISEGKAGADDRFVNQVATVQDMIPSVVVPLAFPLLLFSLNFRRWLRFARKGFISVILALIAGVTMVTAGFFVFKDSIPESWRLAGMFVGIYTGGTPNFVALKMALDVDANLFIVASTYDVIVGAFLVLFFITVAPKIFRFILPPFRDTGNEIDTHVVINDTEDLEDFSGMLNKRRILPLLAALGVSLVILLVSLGISMLLPGLPQMVVVILSITTLAIIGSQIRWLNRIEKTFQLGMYLILIFSLTVASIADLRTMFSIGMLNLILFITWVYFGSLMFHIVLARIFGIDSDNFLITSAAFIFSPPFVPLVASALKNKDVIVTGITGGIIGYILGNYIGVALAYFLKGF